MGISIRLLTFCHIYLVVLQGDFDMLKDVNADDELTTDVEVKGKSALKKDEVMKISLY